MDTAGYLTELKKLLNDVIKESVKSGSDGSESDFVDRGKFYLERLMLGEYIGQGRFFNRRSKDQANLEKTWEEIRPEIEQKCSRNAVPGRWLLRSGSLQLRH